jgi:hypothetical protein
MGKDFAPLVFVPICLSESCRNEEIFGLRLSLVASIGMAFPTWRFLLIDAEDLRRIALLAPPHSAAERPERSPCPASTSGSRQDSVRSSDEQGITFRMGQTHVPRYTKALLDKVQWGEIDPSFVITHRVSRSDATAAYKTFRDKQDGCIKVVMKP